MFPSLTPRATDPLWFSVDRPADEEAELAREEAEHQAVGGVQNRAANYQPVFTIPERPLRVETLLRHFAKFANLGCGTLM